MKDHSKAFARLRLLGRLTTKAELMIMITRPISAAGKIAKFTRLEQFAEGLTELAQTKEQGLWLSENIIGARQEMSEIVRSLWATAPIVATVKAGDSNYTWRDVYGVPVVCDYDPGHYWFRSPEGVAEIMARMRALGRSWRILGDGGGVVPDDRQVPTSHTTQTQQIIDRTRCFEGPRSWLLWGPPGGGKTVAARQVVVALSSMSVTLSPSAVGDPAVWDCLDALRPDGLLIDDVDSVADKDSLLSHLETARGYARVIVCTANVKDALRGAIQRPGRAADDAPVCFGDVDPDTAALIAPSIPQEARELGLLACYLAELEARAIGPGVTAADVTEMIDRMKAAGDR